MTRRIIAQKLNNLKPFQQTNQKRNDRIYELKATLNFSYTQIQFEIYKEFGDRLSHTMIREIYLREEKRRDEGVSMDNE